MNNEIYVTQPSLPSLEEFIPYLEKIWDNKILTNCGPFHRQLESELCNYLGVKYISLFSNATIALITALQALNIKGEVITTPYSFVATANSIIWNNLKPVFVDVEPGTYNIDPNKIRAAITKDTKAIMPVHCYGYPCDYKQIDIIAKENNIKVIYDAAHAFAVSDENGSILNHGDLSILSFHATKVFNTFEGGAIICHSAEMKIKIDQLKNFGITDELTVVAPGINGKMSELNAAFGLLQIKHIDDALRKRKDLKEAYDSLLEGINGIKTIPFPSGLKENNSYLPILVEKDFKLSRDGLYEYLKENGIFGRRYFFPLISQFPIYNIFPSADDKNLTTAVKLSSKVLCLPIYSELSLDEVNRIVALIAEANK